MTWRRTVSGNWWFCQEFEIVFLILPQGHQIPLCWASYSLSGSFVGWRINILLKYIFTMTGELLWTLIGRMFMCPVFYLYRCSFSPFLILLADSLSQMLPIWLLCAKNWRGLEKFPGRLALSLCRLGWKYNYYVNINISLLKYQNVFRLYQLF